MRKIPYFSVVLFIIVASCFLTAQITYTQTDKQWKNDIERLIYSPDNEVAESLSEAMETVSEHSMYVEDTKTMSDGAIKGYVEAMPDRFSMYLNAEEYKEYLDFKSYASVKGIGVSTIYDSECEGIKIISVYKGSPAEQSGIVPGDIIMAVDGKSVSKMSYYSTMSLLGGGEGSAEKISLEIKKHDKRTVVLEITKNQVTQVNITGESVVIEKQNSEVPIGIIRIHRFDSNSAEEVALFEAVLTSLVEEGCERFVIDVRNNPGGSIETVSQMLDCFLREGPVFTVSYSYGKEETVLANSGKTKLPYPYMFAVLVNENTVCEAEVFAKALSNSGTAQLFGTATYGKASVQGLYELSTGGAVSLSYAKYLPSGSTDFEGVGIEPENVVELPIQAKMSFTTITFEEDTQLCAAAEYLSSQKKIELKD